MKRAKKRSRYAMQDAYGAELLATHAGENDFEIVERDDGYIEAGTTVKMYFTEYADWSPAEKKAIRHAKGRVLDIGCGAGRHALYLQSRGLDVLATDVSPGAVKVSRLRGVKKTRCVGIDDLSPALGMFDTLVMFGNNFGLFGSPEKAKRLLRRFHRMTSDGARIIAQCMDPYGTTFEPHLEYHRFNRKRGRMSGQLRIRVCFRKWRSPWFDYLFVSRSELAEILKGTGWRVREHIPPRGASYFAILEKTGKKPSRGAVRN